MENNKHLLIVEDEDGIRSALCMVFEDCGFLVTTAGTGQEAIRLLKGKQVDLVITDILMPDGDGLELINYLKKVHPEVKSIVISGGDPTYLSVSQCMGADRVLAKPFERQKLLGMVNELVA